MKVFLKEILYFLFFAALAVITLPVYLFLVWLVEVSESFSELITKANVIVGVVSLFFCFYWTRWIVSFCKDLRLKFFSP